MTGKSLDNIAVKVKAAFRAVEVSVTAGREVCYNFVLETVWTVIAAFFVPQNIKFFMVQSEFLRFKRKLADAFLFLHPGAFLLFLLLFFPFGLFGAETVFTGETFGLHETLFFGAVFPEKVSGKTSGEETEQNARETFIGEESGEVDKEISWHWYKIFWFLDGFISAVLIVKLLFFLRNIHRERRLYNYLVQENEKK